MLGAGQVCTACSPLLRNFHCRLVLVVAQKPGLAHPLDSVPVPTGLGQWAGTLGGRLTSSAAVPTTHLPAQPSPRCGQEPDLFALVLWLHRVA